MGFCFGFRHRQFRDHAAAIILIPLVWCLVCNRQTTTQPYTLPSVPKHTALQLPSFLVVYGAETAIVSPCVGVVGLDPSSESTGHWSRGIAGKKIMNDLGALKPDLGKEESFLVADSPFAFSPGQLSKMFNPKSLSAFYELGGLKVLEEGLQTDRKAGQSLDELNMGGSVSFEEAPSTPNSKLMAFGEFPAKMALDRGWTDWPKDDRTAHLLVPPGGGSPGMAAATTNLDGTPSSGNVTPKDTSSLGANAADLSAAESPPDDHPPAMATAQGQAPGGDRLLTARELARECGLEPNGAMELVESPVFRNLSAAEMTVVAPRLRAIAQSSPEDKRLLVEKLKSLGSTVTATGNADDVPALVAAGVGFSMGATGTAVAREAAQIVLMDDSFSSVIAALAWGRTVNTAVQKFPQLQLLVNVTAALLYVVAVASGGDLRWMLVAQTAWWYICIDNLISTWSEYHATNNPDWSAWIPSRIRSLGVDLHLGGQHKRRQRFQSQNRARSSHAGSRGSATNCFDQLAIDLPWVRSDWLQHKSNLETTRTTALHLSRAHLHSNRPRHAGHGDVGTNQILAWHWETTPNNANLCYLVIGLVQLLPRNPRQLSLMVAAALLLAIPPAAAAWTRAQTVFVLDVCVGAVAGTSAVTVAVLRTKGQDPEAKWWITAYSCWAVAFTLALVEALLKPSVLGRRKAFLCATFLLAAHLNRSLGGQGSSAVDTVLTYGPLWLVVSLYLMTVLVDAWPDIVRATFGV
ncbi:hypothetical protein RB597_005163 [Gaeumannomyces tritici]